MQMTNWNLKISKSHNSFKHPYFKLSIQERIISELRAFPKLIFFPKNNFYIKSKNTKNNF